MGKRDEIVVVARELASARDRRLAQWEIGVAAAISPLCLSAQTAQ